ncbi:MFS transporter [Terrabacter aeriphilus]
MRRPTAAHALVLEGFTSRLSFGLVTFALPLYGRELGMSIAEVGLLASFSVIVSLALKPLAGVVADRIGLKRALLVALGLRSLLCLGYLATSTPLQVFAVRGSHGVSDSLRDPSVHALLAETAPPRKVAGTFAWYQTAKTSAGAIGKSLSGVLLVAAGGFTWTFVTAFALSLLPLVVVAALVPARRPTASPTPSGGSLRNGASDRPPAPPSSSPRRQPPGVAAFAVLGFLVSGTSALLTTLFPVIATEYAGLSPAQAGALYLLTPVLALTGPLWGRLSDRVSRPLVLSFRSAANIGSAAIYLLWPNPAGLWTGKSLDDLGKAAFRPAWGSLMAEVASRTPSRRARTMAYLTAGEDAGDIAAPLVAGLLWTGWGVPALLITRMVAAVVSEGYALWLDHRSRAAAHDERTDRSPRSLVPPNRL